MFYVLNLKDGQFLTNSFEAMLKYLDNLDSEIRSIKIYDKEETFYSEK